MKKTFVLLLILLAANLHAQKFTRQDTLRGSITPERAWWDLNYYHLDIQIDPQARTIKGTNAIRFTPVNPGKVMQVDLQRPMKINKVTFQDDELTFKRDGNAWFFYFDEIPEADKVHEVIVHYSGKPKEAVRAPWDGGISWEEDKNGNHFIATSCQGLGASVWWPNKDHMYDEVDSMKISVRVPDKLMNVSNGRLTKVTEHSDDTKTWSWYVDNPINNYGVNANVGDYVTFGETYQGEKGALDMQYYVLSYNLEKAREQFKQAPMTIEAFEHWFGPYPFYEDGFKLVEVPYLGMEHQSSVTYGNGYQNGYLGSDLSGTGWGLKFDFIIVHETGHEWFANNITYKDIADMWIHESFTAYSEGLYLEYHFGKQAGAEYLIGTRANIANNRPIIGPYGVNKEGSSDMYPKGANMLHTLRQLIDDDEKWRAILRGLNEEFYHQTVTSRQIENYISEKAGKDLSAFFDQYLRDTRIPMLQYRIEGNRLFYRYTDVVKDFDMPVMVKIDEEEKWLYPDSTWQKLNSENDIKTLQVDPDFYIRSSKVE
ncbi:M1 family metallopeptidase [Robertkochia aurantiaca]|uniref:M1 family metallopeptidase n=1 Tax=Robertkochia aurantiaca TaxID=2873700 RepID=UPI001CCDDFAD|nr:M1 family metallopeptidase [Robertkochia sp. 3YJGBD-33]